MGQAILTLIAPLVDDLASFLKEKGDELITNEIVILLIVIFVLSGFIYMAKFI